MEKKIGKDLGFNEFGRLILLANWLSVWKERSSLDFLGAKKSLFKISGSTFLELCIVGLKCSIIVKMCG